MVRLTVKGLRSNEHRRGNRRGDSDRHEALQVMEKKRSKVLPVHRPDVHERFRGRETLDDHRGGEAVGRLDRPYPLLVPYRTWFAEVRSSRHTREAFLCNFENS